jgi:arabinose-5-phosphate isomerase
VVTGWEKAARSGVKSLDSGFDGTPALFVHATEALHGDLGMVTSGDVLLAISYSGRSDELLSLLPAVRAQNVRLSR